MYQGLHKSFPVEEEDDFYQRVRYVEPNALRAGLVERAEAWRWCSLWRRTSGAPEQKQLLSDWPVAYPKGWCKLAGQPQTEAELAATGRCVARGQPYESEQWVCRTAEQRGPESTLRAPYRPRKGPPNQ